MLVAVTVVSPVERRNCIVSRTVWNRTASYPSLPSRPTVLCTKRCLRFSEDPARKFAAFARWALLDNFFLFSYLFHPHFQEIKGLKEGEDPEDGEAKEEGVTFNLWKKTEQPPPAEPVYDEVRQTTVIVMLGGHTLSCLQLSFLWKSG